MNETGHLFQGGVPINEYQAAAELEAQKFADNFTTEGIRIIDQLLTEVETMQLAHRFDRTTSVEEVRERAITSTINLTYPVEEAIEHEGEAGMKRQQLRSNLISIRNQLLAAAGSLKDTVMDMKASQIE